MNRDTRLCSRSRDTRLRDSSRDTSLLNRNARLCSRSRDTRLRDSSRDTWLLNRDTRLCSRSRDTRLWHRRLLARNLASNAPEDQCGRTEGNHQRGAQPPAEEPPRAVGTPRRRGHRLAQRPLAIRAPLFFQTTQRLENGTHRAPPRSASLDGPRRQRHRRNRRRRLAPRISRAAPLTSSVPISRAPAA